MGKKVAWNVNEEFLDQSIKRGDEIILTSNPYEAKRWFAKEVNYLEDKGFEFIKHRDYWKAVKK